MKITRISLWQLVPDIAPGRGARTVDGQIAAPEAPGLGVAPDPDMIGEAIAVYP